MKSRANIIVSLDLEINKLYLASATFSFVHLAILHDVTNYRLNLSINLQTQRCEALAYLAIAREISLAFMSHNKRDDRYNGYIIILVMIVPYVHNTMQECVELKDRRDIAHNMIHAREACDVV